MRRPGAAIREMTGRKAKARRDVIVAAIAARPGMTVNDVADALAAVGLRPPEGTMRNDLLFLTLRARKLRRCPGREVGASQFGGEPIAWELRKEGE